MGERDHNLETRPSWPERVGPFSVRGILGKGTMGVVLDAIAPNGEQVALKLLRRPSDPDLAELASRRFLREAKILGRISHPNIVRLVDAGEVDGSLYLAMQRLEGTSLRDLRQAGPLAIEALIPLGIDLALALDHLHQAGVLHRDIKPANVLIGATGRPVIADFGISRADDVTEVTRQGDLLGSPGYMAPELMEGLPPTMASDQYALGRLIFELGATGTTPRPAPGPILEVLRRALEVDWDRWPAGDAWSALGAIVRRAMASDPNDRFGSAGQLGQALRDLQAVDTARSAPAFDGNITLDDRDATLQHLQGAAEPLPEAPPEPELTNPPLPPLRLPGPSPRDAEAIERATPLSEMLAKRGEAAPAVVPVDDLAVAPLSSSPPPARLERQIAALREQLAQAKRSAQRARSLALAVAIPVAALAGGGAGWLIPHRAPEAPVVVLSPAGSELGEVRAQMPDGRTPSSGDLADARGMLINAQAAFAKGDFQSAARALGLCIEIADLPDCHKLLGTYLALSGHPAARTHLEHYLRIAPAAPDAPQIRRALGVDPP